MSNYVFPPFIFLKSNTHHHSSPSLPLSFSMISNQTRSRSFNRGVCGKAASTASTQLIDDVHNFPGHIACDSESKSEIVVPILGESGEVVAIIDVDCTLLGGFDEMDRVVCHPLIV